MGLGFDFDAGGGTDGFAGAGSKAAAWPLSGSRNSHEAKPSRLVWPTLESAHHVMFSPNRTRPMTTVSPLARVAFTSAVSDIDAYTGSVSLLTTARAPAATVCAGDAVAASRARQRPRKLADLCINSSI